MYLIIKSHFESKPITFDTDYSIGFGKIEQTMLPYSLLFSQKKNRFRDGFLIGQGESEMENEIETRKKKCSKVMVKLASIFSAK